MATYYRWRKSEIGYTEGSVDREEGDNRQVETSSNNIQYMRTKPPVVIRNGRPYYDFNGSAQTSGSNTPESDPYDCSNLYWYGHYAGGQVFYKTMMIFGGGAYHADDSTPKNVWAKAPYTYYHLDVGPGDFVEYVYSLNSSTYPNGGVSDDNDYYYGQRTTITSPTAPSGLNTPNPITTPSITVSWSAATSNVPDYPVNLYELSYSVNGGSSWTVAGTTAGTSLEVDIPAGTTSIRFRVRARDSNGQWGSYSTSSTAVPVYLAPTLTVPSLAMQGQSIAVNWTAITGADSYTLQRKSSADTDWTQVYSGANTTFSETAGTWTTVQYRVQAVFNGTPGGWATSAMIPVVSASALVISGQDGDLGTLVNDVPYSISTDTGNQITATITVNGAVIFSGNVGNSTAGVIPVMDLITGEGTITIEASVTASSGPVSAVRTWTYTKDLITFPNSGSVAQVTKEGENIYPKVLAEGVRLPGGKTLDQVMGFPAQIFTGSYVGTGTYGQSNPNTLTFPFEPKAVFISDEGTGTGSYRRKTMLAVSKASWGQTVIGAQTTGEVLLTWGQNSLSWYSSDAGNQLNQEGVTAYYVAIG